MATIVIRHTHAEGTLIEGSRKGDGVYEIARRHGFTYFPSIRAIGIRGSRDHLARRDRINACAEALRAAGHEVTVEIDDTPRDRGQVLADQADRLDDRRDALKAKADRLNARADALRKHSDRLVEHIPPGQPILVGHHSERRHRRTLERSINAMLKAADTSARAREVERRANAVGKNLDHSARPDVIARRIKRLEAELRKVERELTGYTRRHLDHSGQPYYVEEHAPATGEHRDALLARQRYLQEQLDYDRAQLEAAKANGFKVWDRTTVHVGDFVNYGLGGWYKVVKVNRTTVSIDSGYSWTCKVPFTDIRQVRCEHGEAQEAGQ